MIRLRSISMPGTLRGAEPVATMISLRARSVCFSPSNTSTPPFPVSRAVPLIQSILFFLKRNSTPLRQPGDDAVLSRLDLDHVDADRPELSTDRHAPFLSRSEQSCSACACSSSALVGMHPQSRQVPPSAFCFSTTATVQAELRGADGGDVSAGSGADHDDVVFVGHVRLVKRAGSGREDPAVLSRGQGDERGDPGAGTRRPERLSCGALEPASRARNCPCS